ncbi:MAG: hypothetical protein ACRC68_16245, partial [Clostridium sp.]
MKKNVKLIMGLLVISIFITICFGFLRNRNQSVSKEIIKIIKNDEERSISDKQLKIYKEQIGNEILSEKSLKKSYYAIGAIDFLEKDYYGSIEKLLVALSYESFYIDDIDIMILSALSSNYIAVGNLEEAEKYYDRAKTLAKDRKMDGALSDLYYGRAKALLNTGATIEEAIDILKESESLNDSYPRKVRNYLFIASLCRVNAKYDLSLDYSVRALEIAIDNKDNKNINSAVINIGENYYVQRDFEKSIYIYEELLNTRDIGDSNRLTIYGYLLVSHSQIGNYEKVEEYKEKYLEIVNKLNEDNKNKELTW